MAVVGVLVLALVLAPITAVVSRIAGAWCSERRHDTTVAAAAVMLFGLAFGLSLVLVPPRPPVGESVLILATAVALWTEIGVLILSANLFVIDHVTGKGEMWFRTMFGGEGIQRRLPLDSLRTPIDVLRRNSNSREANIRRHRR